MSSSTSEQGRSRGRSRPFSKTEAKWQSSDNNMPGPKPKLGVMGRQLSEATYVLQNHQFTILRKFLKSEIQAGRTVWEFYNFTASQILRQIKLWHIEIVKKCDFDNFRGSELRFYQICAISEGSKRL